ncbi:hypothetical protein AB0I68_23555 [Streptomyces sp. NPDC050448]|uniref:hypothetical protein n=1 Tax=Streptomyces sp. NPDC050448 TaxID=3155404 RepID=UPI00343E4AD2
MHGCVTSSYTSTPGDIIRTSRFALPMLVCTASLAVTACGSSAPTAAEVFDKSRKATERVRSATVTASLKLEDGRSVQGRLFIDAQGNCEGELIFPRAGAAHVLVVGARVYIKGDDGYLESVFQEPGERDRLRGSWADFEASDPLIRPVTAVCEASRPMAPFALDRSATVLDSASHVDTRPVAVFKTPGAGGGTITESVAAEGKPYIVARNEFGGPTSLNLSGMAYSTSTERPVGAPAQGVLPAHRGGVVA